MRLDVDIGQKFEITWRKGKLSNGVSVRYVQEFELDIADRVGEARRIKHRLVSDSGILSVIEIYHQSSLASAYDPWRIRHTQRCDSSHRHDPLMGISYVRLASPTKSGNWYFWRKESQP